jgi:hypothetical protein
MTWHSGTHELRRGIGNCRSKLCFRDENTFTLLPTTLLGVKFTPTAGVGVAIITVGRKREGRRTFMW